MNEINITIEFYHTAAEDEHEVEICNTQSITIKDTNISSIYSFINEKDIMTTIKELNSKCGVSTIQKVKYIITKDKKTISYNEEDLRNLTTFKNLSTLCFKE